MSRQAAGHALFALALLLSLVACGQVTAADGAATPTATSGAGTVTPAPLPSPTAMSAIGTVAPPTATATTPVATATTAPSPTAPATATPPPAATSTPAAAPSPSAAPVLQPTGPVPPGWRQYRGSAVRFAIAYPSDWTVDESQAGQGLIYFYAPVPDRSVFLVVGTTGMAEAAANIDVLRDRWFHTRTQGCARFGIEETDQRVVAGSVFATLGATCDLPDGLSYSFTGLGLRHLVPWVFEFNAPYAVYDVALANGFEPMLRTLALADPGPSR